MRLKYLWIEKFKNLKNFEINFENNDGLTMLIGNNGSGKSNILEIISQIFYDSYYNKNTLNSEYSLFYELSDKLINIVSYRTVPYVFEFGITNTNSDISFVYSLFKNKEWWTEDTSPEDIEKLKSYLWYTDYSTIIDAVKKIIDNVTQNMIISGNQILILFENICVHFFSKREKLLNLPQDIVTVYSGENFRIRQLYDKKHMRMNYIDSTFSEEALATYMLSYLEDNKLFLKNNLCISDANHIKITFDYSKIKDEYKNVFQYFPHDVLCSIDESFVEFQKRFSQQFLSSETNEINYLNSLLNDEQEIFNAFVSCKATKAIANFKITFNNNLTIDDLSEGEKRQLLLHALVDFVSYENSIILMDEPDAYIHESKKLDLYYLFESYCKEYGRNIIMTTHSPTFLDLSEPENIVMLKVNAEGTTDIYDANKLEQICYLTGSRFNAFLEKPILYCEGTETSVEAKLYPILFPDYKVISSGGHEEVINNTKMYNRTFGNENHKAIGIIDWDYKSQEQLTSLKEENVYSLSVLEIENILMDKFLLLTAESQFCAEEGSFERIKQKIFSECLICKEKQATKHVSSYIISKIKSGLTQENRDIENFKTSISEICNIQNIDLEYQERLTKLVEYTTTQNYDELFPIFDFNHYVDRFIKDDIVNNYQQKILKLIEKTKDLQMQIRQKYFNEIENPTEEG